MTGDTYWISIRVTTPDDSTNGADIKADVQSALDRDLGGYAPVVTAVFEDVS